MMEEKMLPVPNEGHRRRQKQNLIKSVKSSEKLESPLAYREPTANSL